MVSGMKWVRYQRTDCGGVSGPALAADRGHPTAEPTRMERLSVLDEGGLPATSIQGFCEPMHLFHATDRTLQIRMQGQPVARG